MKLYDHEERLIATDEDGTKGAVWSGTWKVIAPTFAGKVWACAERLTPRQALERFPGANLRELSAGPHFITPLT